MKETIEDFQNAVSKLGYAKRTTDYDYYNQDYEYTQYWTHPNGAEIELYHDGSDTLPPKALCYNKSSLSRAQFRIDLHNYRLEATEAAEKSAQGMQSWQESFENTEHGCDWVLCMRRSKYGANLAYWNARDFAPDTYEKMKSRITEFYEEN